MCHDEVSRAVFVNRGKGRMCDKCCVRGVLWKPGEEGPVSEKRQEDIHNRHLGERGSGLQTYHSRLLLKRLSVWFRDSSSIIPPRVLLAAKSRSSCGRSCNKRPTPAEKAVDTKPIKAVDITLV